MDDPGALAVGVTSLLSGAGGAVAAVLALRRKASRDSLAIADDAVEKRHLRRREADYEALAAECAKLRERDEATSQRLAMEYAAHTVLQGDYARLEHRYETLRHRAQRLEAVLVRHGARAAEEAGEFDTDIAGLGPAIEPAPMRGHPMRRKGDNP